MRLRGIPPTGPSAGKIIAYPVYVDPAETGGGVSWGLVTGKPTVIAAGNTAAAARLEIEAVSTAELDAVDAAKQPLDSDLTALAALTDPAGKLSGIATGATANDTDANLKARANHTGTQTSSTISDLTETVQDIVGAQITAGANVGVAYNDATGSITIDATGGGGSGTVTGPVSSVDSEVVLFSGTSGTALKRGTGSGLAKLTSGVLGTATAGTDYLTPSGSAAALTSFPTLNQNTTGSAATLTTARNIDGVPFNGSANVTVIAPAAHAATAKTAPLDADELPLVDTAASNVLKKLTIGDLKDALNIAGTRTVSSVTNITSWTVDVDTTDVAVNSGLTGGVTVNNPVGTPGTNQLLWLTVVGTASRAITYGSAFEDSTVTRPTTTSGTNPLDIGFRWNVASSKWRCISVV